MQKIFILILITQSWVLKIYSQDDQLFRGNPSHNMNYKGFDDSIYNKVLWSFKTSGAVRSTAIAVNNMICFGSSDSYLYALNSASGKLIWRYNCGSSVTSSPAYSKGVIYILSEQQILIALNVTDGKLIWKKVIGEDKPYDWGFDYYFPSPVINGDTLLIASADGKVLSLNKKDGKRFWQFNTKYFIRATPTLINGVVYIGDTNGDMYALYSKTGKQKWMFQTFGSSLNNDTIGFDRKAILSSAVADDDAIVFGSRDGFLYCLNTLDGTLRWKFDHKVSWVISSPSIVNGQVITGTSDGHFIQSVNIKTGEEKWRAYGAAPLWSSPLVVGNYVYIGGNEGVLHCIDVSNGKKVAHPFCVNAKIFSSPGVNNHKMFFGADDGVFYCLQQQAVNKQVFNRYVYWDKANGSLFFRNGIDLLLKDFLYRKGFTVIDQSKLASIVEENKNSGKGSIIIFVSSRLPDSFMKTDSVNVFHNFLESGGIAVDLGNSPFIYDLDSSGNFNGFNFKRLASIIGINFSENDLRSYGGIFTATATDKGKYFGIKDHWTAACPVNKKDVDIVLGIDEKGRASAWIKNIGKGKFIQLWVDQTFPEDYNFIDNVLANIERM